MVLSLHSPSVVPGNTLYVQNDADLAVLLQRLRAHLAFFRDELHGRFVTPEARPNSSSWRRNSIGRRARARWQRGRPGRPVGARLPPESGSRRGAGALLLDLRAAAIGALRQPAAP